MNPEIQFYNTPSRRKEKFAPLTPGLVRIYCCGPTVYHFAHIGNLRTYVFEDLLRRVLEYAEYNVQHVVNITDVGHLTSDADTGEDKMEKGARREGKSVWETADFYTRAFQKDWERLGLLPPSEWTKATDNIPEQIDLVHRLEAKGFAYVIEGDGVYFDTAKFPAYGDFAGLDIEGMQAGARIGMVEGKRNLTDFALWKFSPGDVQRAMEWESPWGKGFPGWHVECSAMALKFLGDTLDIHCGGVDHIRVHHTNEIAQSQCATGKTFARYWLHGGWLLQKSDEDGGGGKMSKSSGEFITLQSTLDRGFSPMDFRYFCLTAHYRNYLNFSWEGLATARDSLRHLRRKTAALSGSVGAWNSETAVAWEERFREAVYDDLNLPQALAVLNLMLKDVDLPDSEKAALTARFDRVLGLGLLTPDAAVDSEALPEDLQSLFEERLQARRDKNYKRSDEIRDLFRARGIVLKDSPEGVTWQRVQS